MYVNKKLKTYSPSCPTCGRQLKYASASDEYVCLYCDKTFRGELVRKGTVKAKPKNKYNATKTTVDGIVFDSGLEAKYYGELKLRLRAGDIKGFCRQPIFLLQEPKGDNRKIEYKPDFIVWENDGSVRVIDTKGMLTDTFKNKKKMFESKFDIRLEIVK